MNKLLLIALPAALAGSPAMSATYYVDGWATGLAQDVEYSQDTPASATGAAEGATFTANASNANGGSVSVFASEGIGDLTGYNGSAGNHYYGLDGRADADVRYTIRVSGPVTGALIPVHIQAVVSATSLDVSGPVNGYYAPILAGADAQFQVEYAEGDLPIGAQNDGILVDAIASTNYDYRYFVDGAGYSAPVVLGNTQDYDQEVMVAANFDVTVNIVAGAGAQFGSTYATDLESAEDGASVDPTFTIDEPGYSAYQLTGLLAGPTGPVTAAAPEPATWAMMLIGFAGLGFAGYRTRRMA
ncbi:MAG: PEP-CTERM sorting domain-containing protein, partial [Hyphomicrobiales bacterium]|nr:PEP-CTERM sorting domain-containing protein [Hyphomicrobiales bacterium]